MPLPVAHGLVGAGVVALSHPRPTSRHYLPLLAGAFFANCPDLDFILVWALSSGAWHRAFTHSLSFAVLTSMSALILWGRAQAGRVPAYGLAFMSHGLLDYMTTKEGGGVKLLWPFSDERMGLRWSGLSELPSRLPPMEVAKTALAECLIFAPLLLVLLLVRRQVEKTSF